MLFTQSGVDDSRLSLLKGIKKVMRPSKNYIHREAIKNAKYIYGENLYEVVTERLETELTHITSSGYSSAFILAHLVTKYAHKNGQLTLSRGSIGSSLVAFLLGITDINPLPPHYYCPSCKRIEFVVDNLVYSGYDLPQKDCPVCGNELLTEGHNIPFEFLAEESRLSTNIKLNVPLFVKDNVPHYADETCEIDILGFVPLEILNLLQKYTRISLMDVDITDSKIYDLFLNSRVIGIDSDEPATLGIPEYGTKFVRDILKKTKPVNFGDLIRISDLSHAENAWIGNAEKLLSDNICDFKALNTSSEDIYNYLISCGLERQSAFEITDNVRKGIFKKNCLKFKKSLDKYNIPKWYIDFLCNIRDMLPKAHSIEYAKLAAIFAWYKIYYPVEFYVAIFNARYSDIKLKFIEKTNDELQIHLDLNGCGLDENDLELFNECIARGITFEKNINSSKYSQAYSVGERKILVNY